MEIGDTVVLGCCGHDDMAGLMMINSLAGARTAGLS